MKLLSFLLFTCLLGCVLPGVQATSYGARTTYRGDCTAAGMSTSTMPATDVNFYDMSGSCIKTESANDVNRRASSYKATATSVKVWQGTSETCDTSASHTTTSSGSCSVSTDRRRRGVAGNQKSIEYKANQVLGANYLFYYKSYGAKNCNTQGTQPTNGTQYTIGATPAKCRMTDVDLTSRTTNGAIEYFRTYQMEHWSYGTVPDVAGPFVQIDKYYANFTANGASSCPTTGIPTQTQYLPGSATGVCIQDGPTSIKVYSSASGGAIQYFGRRRRASHDCSTYPTGTIKSSASFVVPSPPAPNPAPSPAPQAFTLAADTCSTDVFDQALRSDEYESKSVKVKWNVATPTIYATQWISEQFSTSMSMGSTCTSTTTCEAANKWPASENTNWGCGIMKRNRRQFSLWDSTICVWNQYLVTSPPQSSTITQRFTYSHLTTLTFTGELKATYETGYGVAIGIYTAVTGWMEGTSVKSTVTATSRRNGVSVSYQAVVPRTQATTVWHSAARVTGATMSTAISTAATALGTSGTVTAPTTQQTSVRLPSTSSNADPTSRTAAGPSTSSVSRSFHTTWTLVGMIVVIASMAIQW